MFDTTWENMKRAAKNVWNDLINLNANVGLGSVLPPPQTYTPPGNAPANQSNGNSTMLIFLGVLFFIVLTRRA